VAHCSPTSSSCSVRTASEADVVSDPTPVSEPVDPAWAPPETASLPSTERPPPFDLRATLEDLAWIAGVYVVLGVVLGIVWSHWGQDADVVHYPGGIGMDEEQLAKVFTSDARYVILGGVASLVAGLVLGLLRKRDLLVTVVLATAGAIGAAFLMRWLGHALGPSDPRDFLRTAAVGTRRADVVSLHGSAALLVWPVGTLVGLMAALLSRSD
jgi:hypothetical protein